MLNAEMYFVSLGRNQDAGDCGFQGKDLGVVAARCQHRKGAHAAHSGGVRHRQIPDGLQTHWRNQRYVEKDASSTNTDTILNVLFPPIIKILCKLMKCKGRKGIVLSLHVFIYVLVCL